MVLGLDPELPGGVLDREQGIGHGSKVLGRGFGAGTVATSPPGHQAVATRGHAGPPKRSGQRGHGGHRSADQGQTRPTTGGQSGRITTWRRRSSPSLVVCTPSMSLMASWTILRSGGDIGSSATGRPGLLDPVGLLRGEALQGLLATGPVPGHVDPEPALERPGVLLGDGGAGQLLDRVQGGPAGTDQQAEVVAGDGDLEVLVVLAGRLDVGVGAEGVHESRTKSRALGSCSSRVMSLMLSPVVPARGSLWSISGRSRVRCRRAGLPLRDGDADVRRSQRRRQLAACPSAAPPAARRCVGHLGSG